MRDACKRSIRPSLSAKLRLAQTSGKPIAQVARELGISDTRVPEWRQELAERGDTLISSITKFLDNERTNEQG